MLVAVGLALNPKRYLKPRESAESHLANYFRPMQMSLVLPMVPL
jgi:hypothetical protein